MALAQTFRIFIGAKSVRTCPMRLRPKMSSTGDTPGERQWRKVGALGRGPWHGFAGAKIRFGAGAGLCLAIFFTGSVVALAPASSLRAADGLCPGEGGTSGGVVSVDERLELTLESGIRLKMAGVDPPRPTPGDPDLDVRARDRLAQWLVGKDILFRPLEPGPDRWGRVVAFVFAAAPEAPNRPGPARLPVGEALIVPASRAMNQARRRALAGAPSSPRRPVRDLQGLAFGPIRIMRSSPRPIACPSPRRRAQLLSKAGLPGSPAGGRA